MMHAEDPEVAVPLHEIITFYSYKGGTGRTMALANVACLFARQRDRTIRVLAVDWDLEAPGLHYYLRSRTSGIADANTEGVVEYFTRIQEIVGSGRVNEQDQEAVAWELLAQVPIDGYRRQTRIPNVDLMPAGRLDDTYSARLGKVNWHLLFENVPALFRVFARRLARDYDVVLVDSRTGMTDISGICTALLPDKLVVVFTANQQSLTGIERLVRNSVEYRKNSRDLRPLLVYPLPSRIDAERDELRKVWRLGDEQHQIEGFQPQFERIFSEVYAMQSCDLTDYFNEVQIQHSPDHSYGEEVAALDVLSADRFSIVRSYEALVQWLGNSAAPWESPNAAKQRRQLEALLLEEKRALDQDPPADALSLKRLQEDVVGRATALRPQHLEAVAAVGRLVETCLRKVDDAQRGVELLRGLVETLPRMGLPATLKALDAILNGTSELRLKGEVQSAQELMGEAIKMFASSEPDLDPAVLDALELIALNLKEAFALNESRALFELLVERRGKLESTESSSTQASLNNLANILWAQGDLAGARTLQERVLEVRRRVLGEEHPDTLTAFNNLASTLWAQGDLAGARTLQELVLEARRRVLGGEHPDTLTAMNNLASTLQAQGDLPAARTLQERVLEVSRRVLGAEHPDMLTAMNNLASTLWTHGDLAGSRSLLERVLEVRRRVLGEEHRDTLTAIANLANTLWAQGDLAGALTLQERVLEVRRRALGEEHPDTLTAMNNLASTLQAQGDLAGARTLQERVLEVSHRVVSEEHPATLTAMNNLAETLRAQGDLAGARTLQERVLEVRRRVLGEEHPDTLTAFNNLASTLWAQGDLAGARTLQELVLEARRRVLGEEHPDTLTAMNNLASTLQAQGGLPAARTLQERVLEVSRRVLGEEHPMALSAMNKLALTLLTMGKLEEASKLQEKALALLSKTVKRTGDLELASVRQPPALQAKKIFLASSSELKTDREAFEIFINRKNKDWVAKGIFLHLDVWEDSLDALSQSRLQDEYNKAIRRCDLFVMLFFTKLARYTEQEFNTAFGQFRATNKPFIFTYFKDVQGGAARASVEDLKSLRAFKERLDGLGHFYTQYKNVDQLTHHFARQLDNLVANGFIEFQPERIASDVAGVPTYQATLTGSGAIAQGPGARAAGAGLVIMGGNNTGNINTGNINTGTQVNTGGGAYVGGNVDTGIGDFIGRDRVMQGISPRDLDSLFAPLLAAIAAQAPANTKAQAVQQIQDLRAEVSKGRQADDGKLGKIIDGLVPLVPGANSAVVTMFATPILSGVAGPVTKFVLDKLIKGG